MNNAKVDFKIINTTKLMFFKGNRFNLNRALINILANAARYSSGEKKLLLLSLRKQSILILECGTMVSLLLNSPY